MFLLSVSFCLQLPPDRRLLICQFPGKRDILYIDPDRIRYIVYTQIGKLQVICLCFPCFIFLQQRFHLFLEPLFCIASAKYQYCRKQDSSCFYYSLMSAHCSSAPVTFLILHLSKIVFISIPLFCHSTFILSINFKDGQMHRINACIFLIAIT